MTRIKKLDQIIKDNDLNQTKFYQAWSKWELGSDALESYANEYGNFIATLWEWWATIGNADQAKVEDRHYDIWASDFCTALGTEIKEILIEQVNELCKTAECMFSEKTSAIAALYVFIAQQASTSEAKIKGLRDHYNYGALSETYFEEHLDTSRLMDLLTQEVGNLDDSETEALLKKAELFAKKLCQALDAIYEKYHTTTQEESCSM